MKYVIEISERNTLSFVQILWVAFSHLRSKFVSINLRTSFASSPRIIVLRFSAIGCSNMGTTVVYFSIAVSIKTFSGRPVIHKL